VEKRWDCAKDRKAWETRLRDLSVGIVLRQEAVESVVGGEKLEIIDS
jgi:hypothetical protein